MDSRLDDILLGMVDCLVTFCWNIYRLGLERSNDKRMYFWCFSSSNCILCAMVLSFWGIRYLSRNVFRRWNLGSNEFWGKYGSGTVCYFGSFTIKYDSNCIINCFNQYIFHYISRFSNFCYRNANDEWNVKSSITH